jgi:hypothetical protein
MTSSPLASSILFGLMALAGPAFAQPLNAAPGAPATSSSETLAATPAPQKAASLASIGLMMDVGVPDGMNAALVYRPTSWLRTHAGGSYNMISAGVRGGLALIPFGAGPSLVLEGGHYFEGNANGLARKFAGDSFKDKAVLDRVGYDYVNGHLGLEMGSRRVTFYIHGGMSYVRATVHNLDSLVEEEATANGAATASTEFSITKNPIVKAWTPSAKLGLIVYLW